MNQTTKDLYASLNMVRHQRRLPAVAVGAASDAALHAAIEAEFAAMADNKSTTAIHLRDDGTLASVFLGKDDHGLSCFALTFAL